MRKLIYWQSNKIHERNTKPWPKGQTIKRASGVKKINPGIYDEFTHPQLLHTAQGLTIDFHKTYKGVNSVTQLMQL